MTLGSNIQKIRKEASLSQEAFAEMFQDRPYLIGKIQRVIQT